MGAIHNHIRNFHQHDNGEKIICSLF
jgi:hypothetical protein